MSTSAPTMVGEEERLAAYGLGRCGTCARIVLDGHLTRQSEGAWRCRDRPDCQRTVRVRLGSSQSGEEVPIESRERVAVVIPVGELPAGEPYLSVGSSHCSQCWRKFAEDELVLVEEEIGRAYRCLACAGLLFMPDTASSQSGLSRRISGLLQR